MSAEDNPTPAPNPNPEADETNTNNPKTPGEIDQDKECQEILEIKDYYEVLGIPKTSDEKEIKKAYKKLAIRFHPDKNQSKSAEETFKKVLFVINIKKISHSFQTLIDPEKREIYDKFGSEEEIRERHAEQQQRNRQYEDEEMDPFDLFQMFFNNIPNNIQNQRARNARRERQNFHTEEDSNNHGREYQRLTPRDLLIKFMPFIILTLFTIIPYVFKTKPYYQFEKSSEFYKKMSTTENKINFYVGERFINKYPTWDDIYEVFMKFLT